MKCGLIFLLVIFLVYPSIAAEEEKKLEVIQKELEESRQKLQETKKKEQEVLGKLVIISKDLKKAETNLNKAERKIVVNEAQIGILSQELRKTQTTLENQKEKLSFRLKEIYKSSGISHLELLFGSTSMSDFLNRLYYLGKIIEQDANLIQETQAELYSTKIKKETLKTKTEEIKELTEVIKEEKEKIQDNLEEKKGVYEELRERRAEWETKIAELEKSSREMEAVIRQKTAEQAKAGKIAQGSGKLDWPLRGRLTSYFGYRRHPYWGGRHLHTGIDIAAPHGTPISAADSGTVIFSSWWDGYGKALVIDHGRGISTVYAHLSRIYLQVGAGVAKGQTIGLVGSTGYSSGPHLHFEVRRNGKPVNPMGYLP